jgi:hypothetical protein
MLNLSSVDIETNMPDMNGCAMTMKNVNISGACADPWEANKVDLKNIVVNVTLCKVLVSKGIISRQELSDAEDEVKDYICSLINGQSRLGEDNEVLKALHSLPKVYEDINQLNTEDVNNYSITEHDI